MSREAIGYCLFYLLEQMLYGRNISIRGKGITIAGSGNVDQFAASKAGNLGAKVITVSNSDGVLHDKDGFTIDKIHFITKLKNKGSRDFKDYTDLYDSRSEEHTSELQSLMRISYAVFCLKKKKQFTHKNTKEHATDNM